MDNIKTILATIKHPETGTDIVNSGIVQNIKIEESKVGLTLVFKPNDPFASSIKEAVSAILKEHFPNKQVRILELHKESKTPKPELPTIGIDGVKNIIAIASGKGGVGKSTVAANLAVALAQSGYSTGLLDADLYGPSIPKMFKVEDAKPVMVERNGHELIEPAEQYGVKMLSIGFFVAADSPVIWRGPAATSALKQLTKQADWGNLDYLLIDLPPGTGDIHITMMQELKLSGAVIVTTPQDVALADVVKGINLFRNEHFNVPIIGLIENMSWFTPAELPDNKYYIFGRDGGKKMAEELNIPLLGQVPLVQSIRECGDEGTPAVLQNSTSEAFKSIVNNILKQLNN